MDKRSLFFVCALSVCLFLFNHLFDKPLPQAPQVVQTEASVEEAPLVFNEEPKVLPSKDGELYVLENDFQQIVFSTMGGSICEINFPFQSEKDVKSLVLPIGFDRTMEKNYPFNDHFPTRSFWSYKNGEQIQVSRGEIGGYYPLLRRSVFGENDKPTHSLSPRYFAFNVVSEEENLSNQPYEVTHYNQNSISFSRMDSYRKITKTFTLSSEKTPYCFEVEIKVEGDGRGLFLTTGIPDVELISNQFTPTLKYLIQKVDKNQVESLSLPKASMSYSSLSPTWISNSNGFFGIIVEPLSEIGAGFKANWIDGTLAPTRLSLIDAQNNLYPADKYSGYELLLPLRTLSSSPFKARVFAGPYQGTLLKEIDATLSLKEKNPNFISAISFQGWFTFISEPFSKFLFLLMNFFYQLTHSWGFSIILLTVALRVMLYPLNEWSIKSSLRMQRISPQISAIQEKYKKEPKKAQMEIMLLYKEKGVNPMTGCLPILIQIPFLIGMFDLLKSIFELRGASFIPGWIDNLTAPDVVFSWNYPLIFFGTSFHLLPLLLGVVMYMQQKISSQGSKNNKNLTDSQRQQKFMGNIMVVVFTVISYHFPSGLNIYWLSSMALGIAQQWFANKYTKQKMPSKR